MGQRAPSSSPLSPQTPSPSQMECNEQSRPHWAFVCFRKGEGSPPAFTTKKCAFPGIKMSVCYLQPKVKGSWQSYSE